MRTFNELSKLETGCLISRVNEVLSVEFQLSDGAINGFWTMLSTGITKTEKA